MMLVITHPACLGHDPGPDHPECPQRLSTVTQALRDGLGEALRWQQARPVKYGELARVHDAGLIETVMATQGQPLHALDQDTYASPGSAEAAVYAAGAGIDAVDAVMEGNASSVFCAIRPPGHHATATAAMGFCLFNNAAIAAAYACDRHALERVAVVDFDVHHGNGTQDIFQHEPRVAYFSCHQAGLFPYSGQRRERGLGNIFNTLLPAGSGGLRFRNTWADEILPAIDDFRPQLLILSAGFDGHMRDPQADLMLDAEDFAWLTCELRQLASRHAGGRIVSLLEGGYDLQALAECSVAHVAALC
jgi:acetoin utilization deacetylase AcuC-like enzyme